MPISSTGQELLYLLTHKLRSISLAQATRHLYDASGLSPAQVREEWDRLQTDGWLASQTTLVHPLLPLAAPIFGWRPGDAPPDFSRLARQLRGRWTAIPAPTVIGWATRKSSRRFGGYVGGAPPRRSETTHDIHLSEVFFRYAVRDADVARRWITDRELVARGGGRGEHLPDAYVPARRPSETGLIIEFGGNYPRRKITAFHMAFEQSSRYDLW